MKGFSAILLLLLMVGVATGIFVGVKALTPAQRVQTVQTSLSPTNPTLVQAETSSRINHYQDSTSGVVFDYPTGWQVVQDSEDQFSARENANYRRNFEGYVSYPPAEVLTAFVVVPEGGQIGSQFEKIPLSVWVFANPENQTPAQFYAKNWYYPFVWGEFSSNDKNKLAPQEGGVIVGYQPGAPKFQLISHGDKMVMIRTITQGDTASISTQILSSLKAN